MIRPREQFFSVQRARKLAAFSFALLYPFVVAVVESEERTAPTRDRFSGRTVRDIEMGMNVVDLRARNAPAPGEKAPALILPEAVTGEPVRLSSLYRDRPLVLFFGSFQCDVVHRGWEAFDMVREKFSDRCAFAMVYVREAHATDGALPQFADFPDPKTLDQRLIMARRFRNAFDVSFPILVDPPSDPAATRWGGWPVRLFVIDPGGTVVYTSVNGPWGFRPSRDFLHGDGSLGPGDEKYSPEPLDEFLAGYLSDEAP